MDHDPEAMELAERLIEGELLESSACMTTNPLTVYVDVCELLDRFDNDTEKLWTFLGDLKDIFA